MRGFTRKLLVTSALTVGAVSLGVAFAAWTATGSGSGTAKAATSTASAVTTDSGAAATLYPGATNGDLYFKVDNNNPYPVRFTSMTAGTVTSSDQSNCPASNVTVSNASGLTIDVAANASTPESETIADVVSMAANAPDGCKGVTFTIAVTLSGTQQ